jgi:methylase of polypeptide subunit release factors
VIVSNPPYVTPGDPHLQEGDVRFEPSSALVAAGDGLSALRTVVAGARQRLVPGGALAVEHGYDQSEAVQAMFRDAGFTGSSRAATSRASRASSARTRLERYLQMMPGDVTDSAQLVTSAGALRVSPIRVSA